MIRYVLTITLPCDVAASVTTHESEAAAHAALASHAQAHGYNIVHSNADSTHGELEGQIQGKYGDRHWETVSLWAVDPQ